MTKGVCPSYARSIDWRSMSGAGSHGTMDRFVLGGWEWGGEDGGERDFGVKNQTGDAYPREAFQTVGVKVSWGMEWWRFTYVKKMKRENSA